MKRGDATGMAESLRSMSWSGTNASVHHRDAREGSTVIEWVNDSTKSVLKDVWGKGNGCKGLGVQVRGHRMGRWKDGKKWRGEERRQQSRETEKWELKSIKWKILPKSWVHIYYFHEGKTKKHHNERLDTSENRCWQRLSLTKLESSSWVLFQTRLRPWALSLACLFHSKNLAKVSLV